LSWPAVLFMLLKVLLLRPVAPPSREPPLPNSDRLPAVMPPPRRLAEEAELGDKVVNPDIPELERLV
jgi:hypothetical protein